MGVYSSYSLHESSTDSNTNECGNLLDLMIENTRDDMKMFDSVIELDFMSAYNETGMISINEEETEEKAKVNIGQKIKDLFKKLIATVKRIISTLISKLQNLMSNDAKLAKTYMKNFDDNGVGYKLKNFRPMYSLAQAQKNFENCLKGLSGAFDDCYTKITTSTENEAMNNATKEFKDDIKKYVDDVNFDNLFFSGDKNKEEYALTQGDVGAIETVMKAGGKNIIDIIKRIGDSTQKDINDKSSQASRDKYTAKATDSSSGAGLARANARYKACNQYATAVSKLTNGACGAASRYVAAARRAFVTAGKKGSASDNGEEAVNAAAISMDVYDVILGEASDMYVESALSMS